MEPRAISQKTLVVSVALSMLIIIIMLFVPCHTVAAANIALPGCPETCGGVQIEYPFGIGPNCSMPGFELSCKTLNDGSLAPFLFNDLQVVETVDILFPLLQVNKSITPSCLNQESSSTISNATDGWNLSGTPYWISNANMLTVIGCDVYANISFGSSATNMLHSGCTTTGCYPDSIVDEVCSGIGCCQIDTPREIKYYKVNFQPRDYNNSSHKNKSSRCNYVVLTDSPLSKFTQQMQVQVSLGWSIGNEDCKTAQANQSSYACISRDSWCADLYFGGYNCYCYSNNGNPYLEGGCPVMRKHCPAFSKQNSAGECQIYMPYVVGLVIGLGFGTSFSAFLLYFAIRKRIESFEKRKQEKLKEKFFNQNRGFLLQQRIASDEDATQRMRIFTLDELEKATNRFDNALILGQGGHGEVYKGILSDQRVAAIKRSKIVDQAEIDQFINEVVILSQVNHRNVVKLYGCCLETEVPLLVYEFISNGTLFNHLHAEPCSLTWDHRLRIALEVARAIAYLHSSASISVFHRDIKSSNILLDDYFTAKVSDFGASRTVQLDQTGITTRIQGTFGYLDPEYYYTGRLTPKSDVYSFGVILAELLTRRKPNSVFFEGSGLVPYFISAMRENRLFEILDSQVASIEGQRTEIGAVANLVKMCVKRNRDERPTIKEVELQLEVLWRSNRLHDHLCTSQTLEERRLLLHDSTALNGTTRQYSFEQELLSTSNFPR